MSKIVLLLLVMLVTYSQTAVPGKKQSTPILLKGGDLYTITDGVKPSTDILFENGKIKHIGKNLTAPSNAEVIDVTGKHVYPGIIASYTQIGLTEISAVQMSNDMDEYGNINPEVTAAVAYNADSEIIPVVRAHGVTHAFVAPTGGMISGRASFVQLDAWTREHATVTHDAGLIVHWPRMSPFTAWWMRLSEKAQLKNIKKNLKHINDYFEKARIYANLKAKNKLPHKDQRFEAMVDYMNGKKKVFITANTFKQIEAAVNFVKKFNLNAVLVQGDDILKAAELVKEANITVLLKMTTNVPNHADNDYDQFYKLPGELAKLGIPFVISTAGRNLVGPTWGNSNLGFSAGHAVAFGLSKEKALAAITIEPAKLFGVENSLGSLEVGKSASIVVSKGDILDPITHKVLYEFIDGRKVNLTNRHKQLYSKFKQKN